MVASGVDNSCAAPAASVVRDASRSLRESPFTRFVDVCLLVRDRRARTCHICATSSATPAPANHIVNKWVGKSFSRWCSINPA